MATRDASNNERSYKKTQDWLGTRKRAGRRRGGRGARDVEREERAGLQLHLPQRGQRGPPERAPPERRDHEREVPRALEEAALLAVRLQARDAQRDLRLELSEGVKCTTMLFNKWQYNFINH